jgi:hypothetical protein
MHSASIAAGNDLRDQDEVGSGAVGLGGDETTAPMIRSNARDRP